MNYYWNLNFSFDINIFVINNFVLFFFPVTNIVAIQIKHFHVCYNRIYYLFYLFYNFFKYVAIILCSNFSFSICLFAIILPNDFEQLPPNAMKRKVVFPSPIFTN